METSENHNMQSTKPVQKLKLYKMATETNEKQPQNINHAHQNFQNIQYRIEIQNFSAQMSPRCRQITFTNSNK